MRANYLNCALFFTIVVMEIFLYSKYFCTETQWPGIGVLTLLLGTLGFLQLPILKQPCPGNTKRYRNNGTKLDILYVSNKCKQNSHKQAIRKYFFNIGVRRL